MGHSSRPVHWARSLIATGIATVIATAASAPAFAAILYNSVDGVVYLGFGGFSEASVRNQAALSNPLLSVGSKTASFSDNGTLNFTTPANNRRSFFNSCGGAVSDSTGLNTLVSGPVFTLTTVMTISGTTAFQAWGSLPTDDDGTTAYNTFANAGAGLTGGPSPTSSMSMRFSNPNGSKWELVYGVVNGLPEVLPMDATSRVSEPATLGIIGLGLGLLGMASQRHRKA